MNKQQVAITGTGKGSHHSLHGPGNKNTNRVSAIGYYFFFGFLWLVACLPVGMQYLFSDVLYFFGYYIIGYRKKVTLGNLAKAFPEKTEKEIRTIARKFYHHLFDMFIESMASLHITAEEISKRFVFRNLELLEQYYKENKSLVVVGGHYGNWEWALHIPLFTSYKILAIFKKMNNEHFNRLYYRLRSRFGVEPVEMNQALRKILEYRQKRVLTITYFIGDQRPLKKHIRHWVKFLNQETPVYLGAEKVAASLDQPVVFVHIQKTKRGHYIGEFIDLVEKPKEAKEFGITEKIMSILEQNIIEKPEFWLWSHRRWKFRKSDFQ